MIKVRYLLFIFLLLFSCKERHNPISLDGFGIAGEYGANWQNSLDIIENLGRIRDLHFEDNRLFIATENKGIYIYDVISEIGENSIPLDNGQYLEQLYHSSEEWNSDKDLRSIYYADNYDILFALDYNNNTYFSYIKFLLDDPCYCAPTNEVTVEDLCDDYDICYCNDDYSICYEDYCYLTEDNEANTEENCPAEADWHCEEKWNKLYQEESCASDANARRFFINEDNDDPEMYVLYKCFDNSLQCPDPYSNVETIILRSLFGNPLCQDFLEATDFSLSSNCTEGYNINDLNVDTNDMFFNDDKFFIANPTDGINSFGVYGSNGLLIDEYNTESPVRSIYSINDVILAGTEDGCYITLLDDNSISDISESKLVIAEGLTIYDIFYDGEHLILSCGNRGVLIYDWNGLPVEPSENLRIFSTNSDYSTTARFFNGMYFIGTKYGLQIYNIE